MKVRKYLQARYMLVAIPATLAITATALGQTVVKTLDSHETTVVSNSQTGQVTKPDVTVDGRHVTVPTSGTTTVPASDGGQTTVSVTPTTDTTTGGTKTTTVEPDGTVDISVTSKATDSHSHQNVTYSHSDNGQTTQQQTVTVQQTGTGSVKVTN